MRPLIVITTSFPEGPGSAESARLQPKGRSTTKISQSLQLTKVPNTWSQGNTCQSTMWP